MLTQLFPISMEIMIMIIKGLMIIIIILIIIIMLFFRGSTALEGPWPPHI
jgi:hypothetical protein